MRRTQLYLDDDVWKMLKAQAETSSTTISELVRQAIRERYLQSHESRRQAMQALVGLRKNRPEFANPEEYIRKIRKGTRLERLGR